jgi:MoaA/NifB/PqqE/SkfB family radical SAM enzyme
VGNLYEQDFIEIWFSQLMMMNRKKLNQGDRNFKPCNVCDVQGSLMGKKHAEAWGKLHNYNIAK